MIRKYATAKISRCTVYTTNTHKVNTRTPTFNNNLTTSTSVQFYKMGRCTLVGDRAHSDNVSAHSGPPSARQDMKEAQCGPKRCASVRHEIGCITKSYISHLYVSGDKQPDRGSIQEKVLTENVSFCLIQTHVLFTHERCETELDERFQFENAVQSGKQLEKAISEMKHKQS